MLRNGGIYAPSVHSHYADHRINFISRTRPIQGSVRCHQIIIINSLPHVRPIKKRGRSWQEPFEPHLHGHTLWLDSYQCPQVQNNPHVPQLSPFGFNRGPECKCGQYHYSIPIHPPAPRHWHWYWILIGRAGLNVVDIVVVASSVVTEQQSSSLRFSRLLNVLSSSRRRRSSSYATVHISWRRVGLEPPANYHYRFHITSPFSGSPDADRHIIAGIYVSISCWQYGAK